MALIDRTDTRWHALEVKREKIGKANLLVSPNENFWLGRSLALP
jgi:hypothetical protein